MDFDMLRKELDKVEEKDLRQAMELFARYIVDPLDTINLIKDAKLPGPLQGAVMCVAIVSIMESVDRKEKRVEAKEKALMDAYSNSDSVISAVIQAADGETTPTP